MEFAAQRQVGGSRESDPGSQGDEIGRARERTCLHLFQRVRSSAAGGWLRHALVVMATPSTACQEGISYVVGLKTRGGPRACPPFLSTLRCLWLSSLALSLARSLARSNRSFPVCREACLWLSTVRWICRTTVRLSGIYWFLRL